MHNPAHALAIAPHSGMLHRVKHSNDCKATFLSPYARRAWWGVRFLMAAVLRWAIRALLEVDD